MSRAAEGASIYSRDVARELIPESRGVADLALERQQLGGLRDKPVIWRPNPGPQTLFLQSTARESLLGGAVGGGKTDALVMGALRWVYNPNYSGIVLRREKDDLREAIDRAREIYSQVCPSANWVENRMRYEFPTGAYILFGSAQHEDDIEAYKTFEFSYIGFDELTTFTRRQYVYMISRNRAKKGAQLPTLIRAGTNPDGIGHDWVFKRFVRGRDPFVIYVYTYQIERPDGSVMDAEVTRQFIPSTVFDNPQLGGLDEYVAGLRAMGKDLADALLYGRWDYFRGQMFPYEFNEVEPGLKQQGHYVIRCMDYGWSNPSVIYWLVVYERPGQKPVVEVASELKLSETSVDGIAHMALRREEKLQRDWDLDTPRLSVIDPSAARSEGTSTGQNIMSMLQAEGLWFEKANNDRQSGWAQIRRLMEDGRLRFWQGECPYLLHSMPKLVRDPKKADDIRTKQDDHGADALRYGVHAFVDMTVPQQASATDADMYAQRQDPMYDRLVGKLQDAKGRDSLTATGLPGGF